MDNIDDFEGLMLINILYLLEQIQCIKKILKKYEKCKKALEKIDDEIEREEKRKNINTSLIEKWENEIQSSLI